MVNLISTSPTRAKILQEFGIDFKQIKFDFDESKIKKNNPKIYSYNVVCEKLNQFKNANLNLDNLLFADSCVVCNNEILGKAIDKNEAFKMLKMQSENFASVITSMIFISKKMQIFDVSETKIKFLKFYDEDLQNYIQSEDWRGKAGAMMIEGFNKKYIDKINGEICVARGLNAKILKAFL